MTAWVAGSSAAAQAQVQCNFGLRRQLRIAGVPVGQEVSQPMPGYDTARPLAPEQAAMRCPAGKQRDREHGSIIVIVSWRSPLWAQERRIVPA
jgi:D-aminopeptidase